jgi:hypothetical protein
MKNKGNDIVAFGDATGAGPSIDCKMKGGESAVADFRRAAIKLDFSKLRLDVVGTGAKDKATDCEISSHE